MTRKIFTPMTAEQRTADAALQAEVAALCPTVESTSADTQIELAALQAEMQALALPLEDRDRACSIIVRMRALKGGK